MSTSSFAKDNYARREIKKLKSGGGGGGGDSTGSLALWGTKTFAVGSTLTSLDEEDFTLEEGARASIVGAKGIIITVSGILSSSGTGGQNKSIAYKVVDSNDKVCAWLNDTNKTCTNEVFKAINDETGCYVQEVSAFIVANNEAISSTYMQNTRVIGHRETGEAFVTPAIKSFLVSFGSNTTVYQTPVEVKVYAKF